MKSILSITLIAAMLFFVTSAWSGSTRYCVENSITWDPPIPGKVWYRGNVIHDRGAVLEGWSEGAIEGFADITQNLEANFKTFEVHIYGKQAISDVTIEGKSGGFDGMYNADCDFFTGCVGQYVAHGSGDLKGMKLFQTSTIGPESNVEYFEGYILDPKGTLPDAPCE